jgi:hypothetical protein
MLTKNLAGQGCYLFAYLTTTGLPKTGDSANITSAISKDGAASSATATANPTEIGAGVYWQPLSQAETNANALAIYSSSTTASVLIVQVFILTDRSGVTVGTNNDKTGYALTTGEHTLISGTDVPAALTAQGLTTARATKLDSLDATVSSRLATASYTAAPATTDIVTALLAATPTLRSQQSITAPNVSDCLVGGWVAAAGKEAVVAGSPPTLTGYLPDGVTAYRTFVLDSATSPTERS